MTDLAVKMFMAANNLTDFDTAQAIMYKYGLASDYETAAAALEPLLVNDGDEGFREGAEFVQDIFLGIKFHLPESAMNSEFARGMEFAMQQAKAVIQAAVDGARMSDEDVERELRVRDASILNLSMDQVCEMFEGIFGNAREQAAR